MTADTLVVHFLCQLVKTLFTFLLVLFNILIKRNIHLIIEARTCLAKRRWEVFLLTKSIHIS